MLFGGVTLPGRPDLDNIAVLDHLPIPMIRNMRRVGVAVDLPYLAALGSEMERELAALERDIASYIPRQSLDWFCRRAGELEETEGEAEINASSAVQIRVLLFDLLKVGRGKKLKLTDTGVVSTGRKQLEQVREDHPVVPLVMQYRERDKLKSAFCDSLPRFARTHPRGKSCPVCELPHREETRRIHGEVMTTRTETGRLSMRRPNLQQIPVKTRLGQKIRAAFVASPGKRLVSCDWSQMELRDLAHLARAESLLKVYRMGGDLHVNTAMQTFGIADERQVDKVKHRMPSKRTNYLMQNGGTGVGLYAQLVGDYIAADLSVPAWLSPEWCTWFIAEWHDVYPEVQPYFERQWYRARRYGFVWDPWGRVRRVPEVRSCHEYIRSAGMRQAQNMPVTASNAEQLKLVMGELDQTYAELRKIGVEAWPVLSIHDQVIAEVDEEYAGIVGEMTAEAFRNVMRDRETGEELWTCPVESEAEVLERWTVV